MATFLCAGKFIRSVDCQNLGSTYSLSSHVTNKKTEAKEVELDTCGLRVRGFLKS